MQTRLSTGLQALQLEQRCGTKDCIRERTGQRKERRGAKRKGGYVSDDDTPPIRLYIRSCGDAITPLVALQALQSPIRDR
jgi:hypothetical protein